MNTACRYFMKASISWQFEHWPVQDGDAASKDVSEGSRNSEQSGIDESLWGRQPASIAGNGVGETVRQWQTRCRKYMLLYFELLEKTGHFDTLLEAHTRMAIDPYRRFRNRLADMAR